MNQVLEDRIREIGYEIYTHAMLHTPSVFDKKRWEGRILEWAMKDEYFKTQLFRYVDLFPALKSDTSVIRLFKEYFSDYTGNFFQILVGIFKAGIQYIPESGLMSKAAARIIRSNIKIIAGQFIAGNNPDEALTVIERMRSNETAFSMYLLGETVVSDKEADNYVEGYLNLIDTLYPIINRWAQNPLLDMDDKGTIPKLNISIKVSSLYSQLDPVDWEGSIEGVKNNFRPVFRKALQLSAFVMFDMEHYYYKDLLIAIFKSILEEEEFKDYNFAGIALQAYLKDTKEDLRSLLNWAREKGRVITIRLVKGAYRDYEIVINRQNGWPVPVFLNKGETDNNFEELTRMLMENTDIVRPAIATHNIRSIANTIALIGELDLDKKAFEFQMLYGMGESLREVVQKMGYRVRVYTPVGEMIPGMAYLVRRLLENTSNESFLRKSFAEGSAFEDLISPPHQIGKAGGGKWEGEPGFCNEPLTDFSKKENREKMTAAIDKIRNECNKEYPLLIGGKEVWTDDSIISVNPARPGEVLGKVSSASIEEAGRAVDQAKTAWRAWRKTSSKERASYLLKVAEILKRDRFDLAALEVFEVGKTWKEADADVAEAIDYMNYYGAEMIRLSSRRLGDYPGEVNDYVYKPKGIGVVISPWNFPLAIPAGMAAASIVAGNCAILKPSGLSPVIGYKLVEIFKDSGLPNGVFQFLPGSGSVIGEYIVTHPDVDFIAFTGSKEIGLKIVELAAKTAPEQRNIKKVIAELGGKNAIIIDGTADLDEAVKGVLESAFEFQGQKCSACSRIIVIEDIYEEFLERFKDASSSLKIGPTDRPGNFMGPVIDRNAFKNIKDYIEIGKTEGVLIFPNVLLVKPNLMHHPPLEKGGQGGFDNRYFIGPTIFTEVSSDARIAQEEIFGPVVAMLKACDIDDAIRIANSTSYALTGGIYSRSPANIRKAREEFRTGNLYINRSITGALVGRQPFGGSGMSGIGSKAGGPDYLLQFMNPICISENTLRKGFVPK